MAKKYLGIFYKSWVMQLHYLPSVIVLQLLMNLTAHLFGYHQFHSIFFNIVLFPILFIGMSLTDQLVHAVLGIFKIKD